MSSTAQALHLGNKSPASESHVVRRRSGVSVHMCLHGSGCSRFGRRQAVLLGAAAGGGLASRVDNSRAESTQNYDAFAPTYNELDGNWQADVLGFNGLREVLLQNAKGDVLEVGVGTFLNLPRYPTSGEKITSLTGIDLSTSMLSIAEDTLRLFDQRSTSIPLDFVKLLPMDAESLNFSDGSFDSVVDTYSMCTFRHPELFLREALRVTRPGGKILLLEHARSSQGMLAAYQDITADIVEQTAKGCRWNQNIAELLAESGIASKATRIHTREALLGTVQLLVIDV
mmetsp:Transcript_509/g.1767  ORF Transcript_509/g.1767 Transcript_509/m.1767 type:complete len:285 (-) Transcript_509:1156-2010(-)